MHHSKGIDSPHLQLDHFTGLFRVDQQAIAVVSLFGVRGGH